MKNIVWHNTTIKLEDRKEILNQKPFVLWFTGLSASGKSTIANIVEQKLFKMIESSKKTCDNYEKQQNALTQLLKIGKIPVTSMKIEQKRSKAVTLN